MIDTHAHLCFPEFDKDREEIVTEARKRMTAVIASSARYEEGLKVLELAKKHKGFVYASLGYHPAEGDRPQDILELVEKSRDKIVAVGEVGLDFHWVKESEKRELQKKWFLKFIELAGRIGKPLVIHSWDAEQECFELVKGRGLDCVFHCFSGKTELVQEVIDHGFYISVSTNVLFSKTTRKVAKAIPLEKMLLETDAPFLDPERKRNVPWNVELSAAKIAELRGIEKEEVIKQTTANAKRVFSL